MNNPNLDILPSIFKKYPDIEAVYLFGSVATGRTHEESDLDLAILPKNNSIKEKKLDILADLTQNGFDAVDLIFIDGNDLVLDYEAVRLNKVIHATEDFSKGATYSLIVHKYLDFLPYLEVHRKALKERILNGQV